MPTYNFLVPYKVSYVNLIIFYVTYAYLDSYAYLYIVSYKASLFTFNTLIV